MLEFKPDKPYHNHEKLKGHPLDKDGKLLLKHNNKNVIISNALREAIYKECKERNLFFISLFLTDDNRLSLKLTDDENSYFHASTFPNLRGGDLDSKQVVNFLQSCGLDDNTSYEFTVNNNGIIEGTKKLIRRSNISVTIVDKDVFYSKESVTEMHFSDTLSKHIMHRRVKYAILTVDTISKNVYIKFTNNNDSSNNTIPIQEDSFIQIDNKLLSDIDLNKSNTFDLEELQTNIFTIKYKPVEKLAGESGIYFTEDMRIILTGDIHNEVKNNSDINVIRIKSNQLDGNLTVALKKNTKVIDRFNDITINRIGSDYFIEPLYENDKFILKNLILNSNNARIGYNALDKKLSKQYSFKEVPSTEELDTFNHMYLQLNHTIMSANIRGISKQINFNKSLRFVKVEFDTNSITIKFGNSDSNINDYDFMIDPLTLDTVQLKNETFYSKLSKFPGLFDNSGIQSVHFEKVESLTFKYEREGEGNV